MRRSRPRWCAAALALAGPSILGLPTPHATAELELSAEAQQEQGLPYIEISGLAAVGARTVALVSSSQGESYLLEIPNDLSQPMPRHRLARLADGLGLSGDKALLWAFGLGRAGYLWVFDLASGVETEIKNDTVLKLGRPVLADQRIWWVSQLGERPTVFFRDPPWIDDQWRHELPEPKGPTDDPARFVFGPLWAAATVTGQPGIQLWRPDGQRWRSVASTEEHSLEGSFEDRLFGLAVGGARIVELEPARPEQGWRTFYEATTGAAVQSDSLHHVGNRNALAFMERAAAGDLRLIEVPLTRNGPISKLSVPRDLMDSETRPYWTWDGSRLTVVRRRSGQLRLTVHGLEQSPPPKPPPTVAVAPPPPPPPVVVSSPKPSPGAAARALGWLKSRLAPTLRRPDGSLARLIDSYDDKTRAGWTYDAALAAIALVAAGEKDAAGELLRGLDILQDTDGSWPFSYDPDRARAFEGKRYAGAMAWVVMAANFFEATTGDRSFAPMARRGLDYLARLRQLDPSSEAFGAISIGPANPQGYSTEHNVDAWSAFYWRGRLDRDAGYLAIAEGIRAWVLEKQWTNDGLGGEGYFKVGWRERDLYLDAQSWSALAFWAGGPERARLAAALETAEARLRSTSPRLGDCTDAIGFKEAEGATIGEKVWGEGTAGMVAALRVAGQIEQAAFYHAQLERCLSASGSLPYASENADGWSTAPAVASTAWFLLNALEPARNPFRPQLRETASILPTTEEETLR